MDVEGDAVAVREGAKGPLVTDEGHHILDLHLRRIGDPPALAAALTAVPGVVEHGLFIGMAGTVVVGRPDGSTEVRHRPGARAGRRGRADAEPGRVTALADFDFDLFVIGGGSGGVRAARVAAEAGARVGARRGVPLRRHLRDPRLRAEEAAWSTPAASPTPSRTRKGFGWSVEPPRFDWPALIAAKDAEIARLEAVYHDTLKRAGVSLFRARATRDRRARGAAGDRGRLLGQAHPDRDRRAAVRARACPAPSSASPRTRCSGSRSSRSG